MSQKYVARQLITFQKNAFDNNYYTMKALYERTEKVLDQFWELSPMFPEQGKKAISEWLHSYKKGCEDFKKVMDDKFAELEDYLKKPD